MGFIVLLVAFALCVSPLHGASMTMESWLSNANCHGKPDMTYSVNLDKCSVAAGGDASISLQECSSSQIEVYVCTDTACSVGCQKQTLTSDQWGVCSSDHANSSQMMTVNCGLSSGAVAGIVIGVVVFVAAVGAVAFFVYRRKRAWYAQVA